jgi:hypothetical protein
MTRKVRGGIADAPSRPCPSCGRAGGRALDRTLWRFVNFYRGSQIRAIAL